jgi:hypothetical protein
MRQKGRKMAKVEAKRKRKSRRTPSRLELIRMFYTSNEAAALAHISASTWSIAQQHPDWASTRRHTDTIIQELISELDQIATSGTSKTYRDWAVATRALVGEAE